jgi:hypothetical protein
MQYSRSSWEAQKREGEIKISIPYSPVSDQKLVAQYAGVRKKGDYPLSISV